MEGRTRVAFFIITNSENYLAMLMKDSCFNYL